MVRNANDLDAKTLKMYDKKLNGFWSDDGDRRIAAEALGEIRDPIVIPILIKGLKSSNVNVLRDITNALRKFDDACLAVPALINKLSCYAFTDYEVTRQTNLMKLLVEIGDSSAVPAIASLLMCKYEKAEQRERGGKIIIPAIWALGELGGAEASSALMGYLGRIGNNTKLGDSLANSLTKVGDIHTIPKLLEMLESHPASEAAQIICSIHVLQEFGSLAAIPHLLALFHNSFDRCYYEKDIKEIIKGAFRKIGEQHASDTLIISCRESDFILRNNFGEIIQSIAQNVNRSVVPDLIKMLGDESSISRNNTAWVLGLIGDESAVPALMERLGDEDNDVRGVSAESLGLIGDIRALNALEFVRKNDAYGWVSKIAYEAITDIRIKHNDSEEDSESKTNAKGDMPVDSKKSDIVYSDNSMKIEDVGLIKGEINSGENVPFSICPYCGMKLNLPKTPKFCPYCEEKFV